jgi:hypothetical protein
MVALVLSVALALVPQSGARPSHPSGGHLPERGLVIPGVSFAGVRIGDSMQRVRHVWGSQFQTCKYCVDPTWLYEYRGNEPLGAAVRFQHGKVVAVFSLGSPAGWRTSKGLHMGDPISNVYGYYKTTGTTRCIGFDAITTRTGNTVTAYYSAAGVIYGFAIVIPSMTVCQ